ncbi:Eukaryotic translation initiation factor 3 subunit E [Venturia nashicola]|uniref:protein-L-isoaspartate(D-aspartate) O-methyltransferase n=1 Tax=Venturia nashicola TaxID=86259 RepID=A0A4Z1NT10_9PEZI|nr:Eukaryotic translation initiation factor 3 subunit E [Venturia nashicola]TLD19498.1 Eukaryotic translation initiation factor 3 subunit E [Venturia nashicola]
MAWRSSGATNKDLINNLFNNGLIKNSRVKDAMLAVDRAHYAPRSPYEDSPQTIGHAATISAPHMHALALESLLPYLTPTSKVLDIGSGSGYLTHVLANLTSPSAVITGIDHIPALTSLAITNISKSPAGREMLTSGRVRFITGDGRKGYLAGEPYDCIHVGAAAAKHHDELVEQLKSPGRLFVPVEEEGEGMQYIWVIDKKEDGSVSKERTIGVKYVPLCDAPVK